MRGRGRRRIESREEYRVFVIVCEGRETEPIYFGRFRQRGRNLRIETPMTGKTDPVGLVKFARQQINRYGLDLAFGDQIWCVFDADQNGETVISKARELAGMDIRIAFSNPSFELWYLLHFAYIESTIDNSALIGRLERHLRDYAKAKDYFDTLSPKRDKAILNARRLNRHHDQDSRALISRASNPSTQVFRLVEEILKIADRRR